MGASSCSWEMFHLWTRRTSCEMFPPCVYGSAAQADAAQLQHTRAKRVSAGMTEVSGSPSSGSAHEAAPLPSAKSCTQASC